MTRVARVLVGAFGAFLLALVVLVVVPGVQLTRIEVPPALYPYTEQEARGRRVYIANGCVYCHSQQVRAPDYGADAARRWGRGSVPGDYVFDRPHLLGTMRTGPDLFNVATRLPDPRWHLLHLYQPRAVAPWSIMPPFPFLFDERVAARPGETALDVPPPWGPREGRVVVPRREALDLVAYLLALSHDYPLVPPRPAEGGRPASPGSGGGPELGPDAFLPPPAGGAAAPANATVAPPSGGPPR